MLGAFPELFFFVSLAGTLFIGLFLVWALQTLGLTHSFIARSDSLDDVTYWIDPWSLQLLFAATISFLTVRVLAHNGPWYRFVVAIQPFVLLFGIWVIGSLLFKPGFGYSRPDYLQEPWLTAVFRDIMLRFGIGFGEAVPSGFVTRQLALACYFALVVNRTFALKGKRLRLFLQTLNIFLLLLIIFLRYYRRDHSLFDIALTLPMATVLFWLLMTPMYRLADDLMDVSRKLARKALWNTVAGYVVVNILLFPYALKPTLTLERTLWILGFFCLAYLAIESAHSLHYTGAIFWKAYYRGRRPY